MSKKTVSSNIKTLVANNKRGYFDYHIEEKIEAGIVLKGTEVKSMRCGKISLNDAHVEEIDGELYITGFSIPEYDKASLFNHYPKRPKKLLLNRKEVKQIMGLIQRKGYTAIALQVYFNQRNLIKVEIGLARGKKQHDKREAIKQREWDRQKNRAVKENR
ncbi:MAG: SsrA-binding protein SmpB [Proteobacteria bacterium]|nr:SsrA-binding protein SmpB [Pseudomonadota bacterium]